MGLGDSGNLPAPPRRVFNPQSPITNDSTNKDQQSSQ
jgi:hypothetical protein